MISKKITPEQIAETFQTGLNCGQITLAAFAEDYGITEAQALRIAACFGGGLQLGKTCGAITSGMILLGLTRDDGMKAEEKIEKYKEKLQEKFGDKRCCNDFLEANMGDHEEAMKVLESGKTLVVCPKIVRGVMDILEEVLAED